MVLIHRKTINSICHIQIKKKKKRKRERERENQSLVMNWWVWWLIPIGVLHVPFNKPLHGSISLQHEIKPILKKNIFIYLFVYSTHHQSSSIPLFLFLKKYHCMLNTVIFMVSVNRFDLMKSVSDLSFASLTYGTQSN